MLNEHALNRLYMPYVSRAKSHGGPNVIQAAIPALLTKNWQNNAASIRKLIVQRFGDSLARQAIFTEFNKFLDGKPELTVLLTQRYKEAYDQAATAQ